MTPLVATLGIVWKSQLGTGAEDSNDCGAAEMEGAAETFKRPVLSVHEVYKAAQFVDDGDGLSLDEVLAWLLKQGISTTRVTIATPEALYAVLRKRQIPISLVVAKPLSDAGLLEIRYDYNHFMTPNAMDSVNVYVHNPYSYTIERGANIPVPIELWFKATSTCNPANQVLLTEPIRNLAPVVVTTNLYKVTASAGANIRNVPTSAGNTPIAVAPLGTILHIRNYDASTPDSYSQIDDGVYNANGTFKTALLGGVSLTGASVVGKYIYTQYLTPYKVPVTV